MGTVILLLILRAPETNRDLITSISRLAALPVTMIGRGSRYCLLFRPLADFILAPLLALQYFTWKPARILTWWSIPRPRRLLYGTGSKEVLHIFEAPGAASSDRFDCCVLVHGGAWGSGFPRLYYGAAMGAAKVVKSKFSILVEYPVYPDATVLEQADCVARALSTIQREFGDGIGIILVGHSSGANIAALALLEAGRAEKPRMAVAAFLALSGVFDIRSHFAWESKRGVEQLSPMAAAAGGDETGWESCSPTLVVRQWSSAAASVASFMPRILLLHGRNDATVPYTSSQEFGDALRDVQCASVEEAYLPDVEHTDPIYALMETSEKKKQCSVVAAIESFLEDGPMERDRLLLKSPDSSNLTRVMT